MNLSYTGSPENTPWWRASYEVEAELGTVREGVVQECDMAPATGGAAPLHVVLHNLNAVHRSEEERAVPVPEFEVDLVDAERLVWVDPWGGCDEQISTDLLSESNPWEYQDVVTLEGYVLGVSPEDPAGAGVRLRFEDRALEYREGDPVTLSLIY